MFHTTELFGHDARFFLTEPRWFPDAAGLPRPAAGSGATRGLALSPWSVFPHECCQYPTRERRWARARVDQPRGGSRRPATNLRRRVRRSPFEHDTAAVFPSTCSRRSRASTVTELLDPAYPDANRGAVARPALSRPGFSVVLRGNMPDRARQTASRMSRNCRIRASVRLRTRISRVLPPP